MDTEAVRDDITAAQGLQQTKDRWLLYLVAPDRNLTQGRGRLARTLSSDHIVFDLSGKEGNPEEYGQELARLAEALKTTEPRAAGAPVYEGGGDSLQL